MSSILKALKKLEQEKTSRFPDLLHIDSDILRTTDSPRRFSPFVIALLFLLVFGGGASLAFFFMNKTKTSPISKSAPPIISNKSNRPVSPPVVKSETLPAEIVITPARKEQNNEAVRKLTPKKLIIKEAESISKNPVKEEISSISEKPEEVTGSITSDIPVLRVNGIAFQNSSDDSMAIVNGIPVSNGSKIEGIAIKEIRKDRVVFLHNGKNFEIQLGQSNR
jgi:general secretion pathway protein B